MDLKFEEVAEQLQGMLARQQEADRERNRQHRELHSQLRHAVGAPREAQEGEEVDEHGEIVVEVPLWRRCFRLVTGKEGYFVWYSLLLMLQMVAIFGLFVESAEDADGSTQTVAGILGASSILSLLLAVPAIFLKRMFFLNVYLVCQIWTCAMAAVFTADAIQDVYKSYGFCNLKGVGGVPDENCPLRESRARGKVFYSLCTALMAVVVGCVAHHIKDAAQREEVEALMRGRGGLMALATGSTQSKKSIAPRSMSRIAGGGTGDQSQPSWKGKTWQSQKAAPSSKKLLQHIAEA